MNARVLLLMFAIGCSDPSSKQVIPPPDRVSEPGDATLHLVTLPSTHPAKQSSLLDYKSLTFTRPQSATEFAADGTIYTVGNDVLRWDPTGEFARLEKPHVQLAKQNEDLSKAIWTKTNCTIADSPFQSARSGETGLPAQSIVATAAGDATIEQKLSIGKMRIGNCSVFIRSDGPPQDVTVELFDGVVSATKTVTSTDTWQRIDVIARNLEQPPACRVGIRGAAAGAKVSVWGINAVGLPSRLIGQVPSHVPTQGVPVNRVQDLLVASAEQVPAHMLAQPWGFKWRPGFSSTGVGEAGAEHDDATFFSVKSLYHEILWVSPRDTHAVLGTIVHGQIIVRADDAEKNTAPIARTQDFSFKYGDTIEVRVNPQNGHISISGALTGNGRGLVEKPWTWPAGHTMWIGERNKFPNTHGLDGFLSEPYAVEPF